MVDGWMDGCARAWIMQASAGRFDRSTNNTNTINTTRHHTAARARDEARDGLDVSESVLLGGGDERDEVRVRMEREQARQRERAGERDRWVLVGWSCVNGGVMCVMVCVNTCK